MSNEIIPFGKYKGQPIDVLKSDRPYLEWLQGQDWFTSKYQSINALIINNFREPSETPEHNKMQALFLEEDFLDSFINHLKHNYSDQFIYQQRESDTKWVDRAFDDKDWEGTRRMEVKFEERGVDVSFGCRIDIEIKPVLSHDYPSVLRQVKSLGCNILFVGEFSADGITIEQVRRIFHPIIVILKSDL